MAGNDVEGLSYAVIDTPEKYWLNWRLISDIDPATRAQIDAECAGIEGRLDQALVLLGAKHRLLEIVHDFIVFDAGIKKTCRPNQYFGVKAAQARVKQREGGIVWHTQGSGKSLTMVWLAKWIREHRAGRPCPAHHRPYRAGRADRRCLRRRQREGLPDEQRYRHAGHAQ